MVFSRSGLFRVRGVFFVVVALAALCAALGLFASREAEAQATPDDEVLVFSKTAGFRHDSIPTGIAAIQTLGRRTASRSTGPRTPPSSPTRTWPVSTRSSSSPPPATCSNARSRPRSRATSPAAAATRASTPRPTPSTTGPGTAAWSAPTSTATPRSRTATVEVADATHPSTAGLPQHWQRTDEWYNFRTNPRGDVHVLATLDETYTAARWASTTRSRGASNYDGGRSWYTGGGHTKESLHRGRRSGTHLLGGIKWAARTSSPASAAAPQWGNFERVTLAKGAEETGEPIGLAVLPDRRVLHTSRDGVVGYTDANATTTLAGTIPVYTHDEDGLQGDRDRPGLRDQPLGLRLLRAAAEHARRATRRPTARRRSSRLQGPQPALALQVGPGDDSSSTSRASRRSSRSDQDRGICCHAGGEIDFDAAGNLYLSTGDDTNPFESDGYAPIDERATRNPAFDAQRSSANTNDLRGKMLRIKPDPTARLHGPGRQPVRAGHGGTRPEIYAMGFRNPFRFARRPGDRLGLRSATTAPTPAAPTRPAAPAARSSST